MKVPVSLRCAAALAVAIPALAQSSASDPSRPPAAAESPLQSILRDALFEEEGARDLTKAAAGYEALIARWNADRALAASAVFRLAEVRRKQDRRDDAVALYQRILREFSDIEPQAKISRENLAALGVAEPAKATGTPSATVPNMDPEEARELDRLKVLAENSPDKIFEPLPWPQAGSEGAKIGPLAHACTKGWRHVATFLLEHGADPNGNPYLGGSPLYAAASNGHRTICELLLEKGAKMSTASGALAATVDRSYPAVFDLLVSKGADLNAEGTAFLDPGGKKCWVQMTPLALAIARDNQVIADKLLELGADVNHQTTGQHLTPLHVAAWRGNAAMLKKLLERKAEVNAVDELSENTAASVRNPATDGTGWTALHYAAGNPEIVDALLKAGASPSEADSHGLTPLHIACYQRQADAVRLLLAAGANREAKGGIRRAPNNPIEFEANTPLQIACSRGGAGIVQMLLEAGANPNPPITKGVQSYSPLSLAAWRVAEAQLKEADRKQAIETVALLMKAGARANDGEVPMAAAIAVPDQPARDTFIGMLVKAGARVEDGLGSAEPEARVELLRTWQFPVLAGRPAVSMVFSHAGITTELATRENPEEQPAGLASLILAWNERGGLRNQITGRPDWNTLHLWRKGDDGTMKESVLTVSADAAFPALKWGDVIEVRSTELAARVNGVEVNPDVLALLRSTQSVHITFKCEGTTTELDLLGRLKTWVPGKNEAPLVPTVKVVSMLAGDRSGMVKIERNEARGGGTIEWPAASGNGTAAPEEGDVITFTPDAQDPGRLSLSLRIAGLPGRWTPDGLPQEMSLLQLLSEFYLPVSWETVLRGRSFPDTAAISAALKSLTPEQVTASLITSDVVRLRPIPAWPDWKQVKVRRVKIESEPAPTGRDGERSVGVPPAEKVTWSEPETIDLQAAMDALKPDSTAEEAMKFDTMLQPGDEVELTLLSEHPDGPWPGLDAAALRLFSKALAAKVTVVEPDGRFRAVTVQWQQPRWMQTSAGLVPLPEPELAGGRVQSVRAGALASSVMPNCYARAVVRGGKALSENNPGPFGVVLRSGDEVHLSFLYNQKPGLPYAVPNGVAIPRPVAPPATMPPSPPIPANNSGVAPRRRVALPETGK